MSVNILYFASLRESLGLATERIVLPEHVQTVGQLRGYLVDRGEAWSQLASEQIRCAVNQQMVDDHAPLGQEIAFFPPVTGG